MESMSEYLVPILILIAVAAVLTFFVFKRRALSKDGLQKGTAAHPGQVKAENPPDPKHRSVNRQGV